jgi:hypothetical protein
MSCRRLYTGLFLLSTGLILLAWPFSAVRAESLSVRLSGRILLQVQAKGEAWYLNPLDLQRYYLGRPTDAFALMRSLGLGVSEDNYRFFSSSGASNLSGRILLRVQAQGEAYYVNPVNKRLYYLGRPSDAFALMRSLGLGISNQDLEQISAAHNSVPTTTLLVGGTRHYVWSYQAKDYNLDFVLSPSLYQSYSRDPKVYTYYEGQEPTDLRESFYGLFLKPRADDTQTGSLLASLRQQAAVLGLSTDEGAAFIMAFVQSLPYDQAKVDSGSSVPYYPFETLYLQKGICADKTFLAVLWLRSLGYGAAILDFPESNHSAAGVACPLADSLAGSGYCYIETTNHFPLGVVPPLLKEGQAIEDESNSVDLFDYTRLGYLEIKQASQGKLYQGVAATKLAAAVWQAEQKALKISKASLNVSQASIDAAYQLLKKQESEMLAYKDSGNIAEYNRLVPAYNSAVAAYQVQAEAYQMAVTAYNEDVQTFNLHYRQFYQ